MWAWAHVHFNQSLSADGGEVVSPDMASGLAARAGNPRLKSRPCLLAFAVSATSGRESGYHAFVIPAFETGRLAGLGYDPTKAPGAYAPAWGPTYPDQPEAQNYPYFTAGIFAPAIAETSVILVTLLKPQPVDKSVGVRDFDVPDPGSDIPPID